MDKLKRFSFLIATVLIVAALAVKVAKPDWQLHAHIAVGIGAFFFLLSLYFERTELKGFFSARSTRYGMNSFVMVLLVLGIVIVANWIAARRTWKWDTTKNKQFSLSSLTINGLKDLKKQVKITAFFTEAQDEGSRVRMKDLLDNYKIHSKLLEIKMVDPYKNPRLTQEYGINVNGTTVVESGAQRTTISTAEEEDVTNAILRVSTDKQTTIYFLEGHGEPSINDYEGPGFSVVVEQLKKSNYGIKELKDFAASAKIPEDCSTLVILAPTAALLDHEIKAIQDFLATGGRALILDDPQADSSLSKILAGYQVTSGNDIVVDDQNFFPLADIAVPLIAAKAATPVTKEFNFPMFFSVAKSLTYGEVEGSKVVYTPFAESTNTSWAESSKQEALFEEDKDKKGPITVGLMVSKPVEDKNKKSNETRLIVFGDFNFAQNALVNIPGNKQIFLNSIAWLTEQENLIHLPPRDSRADVMMLSSTQLNYIALVIVLVMPLAVLGTGIGIWMKRKKL